MTREPVLLDTGPIVAVIDQRDSHHDICNRMLSEITGSFITTDAVVAEACFLLRRVYEGPLRAVRFILQIGVLVMAPETEGLWRIFALMSKYRDAPMDYADASLVALGEHTETRRIFTLDRRHFLTYRLYDRLPFEIVP